MAYAVWVEPTANPPGGNVPAPINVGPDTQYKEGALGIGGLLAAYSGFWLNNNGQNVSGKVLTADASGFGTWQAQAAGDGGGGGGEKYALIQDQKPSTTSGGPTTASSWQTRDLNTEVVDANNIVTVAANQFTLGAGTYRIRAEVPAYNTDVHKAKLYNVTGDGEDVAGCLGSSAQSAWGYAGATPSVVVCEFTITGTKTFEIRHYCWGSSGENALGIPTNIPGYPEIYTQVEIWKGAFGMGAYTWQEVSTSDTNDFDVNCEYKFQIDFPSFTMANTVVYANFVSEGSGRINGGDACTNLHVYKDKKYQVLWWSPGAGGCSGGLGYIPILKFWKRCN